MGSPESRPEGDSSDNIIDRIERATAGNPEAKVVAYSRLNGVLMGLALDEIFADRGNMKDAAGLVESALATKAVAEQIAEESHISRAVLTDAFRQGVLSTKKYGGNSSTQQAGGPGGLNFPVLPEGFQTSPGPGNIHPEGYHTGSTGREHKG